ncbi:hypothetical protein TNCV_4179651 [Trichonephila clavipes]|nr:hypothetical protein TNCV_4179651 [Trichonephila clavipes]
MTNKKLVMGQIDHIKDSLKSIRKPLVRKVRDVDHGRVTPHGRSPEINVKLIVLRRRGPAIKRSKICKKRSRQGSDHQDRKRHAPEQRQGVKRSIPSSFSSNNNKFQRPNTSSPEYSPLQVHQSCLIAGMLRLQVDPEWKLVDVITRPVKPERQREDTTNKRRENNPVESNQYKKTLPILSTEPYTRKRQNP